MANSYGALAKPVGPITADSLTAAYITRLEDENEELRERILQLELASKVNPLTDMLPVEFCLTISEAAVLLALFGREQMTKEGILEAVYGHRPGGDTPELKIIDVYICKIRKKITPFGIEIETLWGRGYRIPPKSKEVMRMAMLLARTGEAPVPTVTQKGN